MARDNTPSNPTLQYSVDGELYGELSQECYLIHFNEITLLFY